MLTSTPCSGPVAVTVSESAERVTVAPIRASTSAKPTSPWRLPVPSPRTVTRPPAIAAAPRK
jgi:hypothetical protein